jgi:hypothetical protein
MTLGEWSAALGIAASSLGAAGWFVHQVVKVERSVRFLDSVPKMQADLEFIKSAVIEYGKKLESHIHSDHRELARRMDDTRDVAVRAAAASQHDI